MVSRKQGAVVSQVQAGSIAHQLGVTRGDKILSINGEAVSDLIDYKFLGADDYLEIELEKADGEIWLLEIEKEIDADLGLAFESPVFDAIKSCANKCVFCFVDQMPPGMRRSLYVKDDDYRLSFLQGNFITLTNLTVADLERIIELRLSPLYVSIHALDREVRNKVFNNPRAAESLQLFHKLLEAGIQVHTQIVLVPGLNDGQVLENTITWLGKMYPQVLSVAVVPVGLTAHREKLSQLRLFTPPEALKVLDYLEKMQGYFSQKYKTRLVFAADEFYFLAQKPFPSYAAYEDFCQLENGVGLTRLFWQQAASWLQENQALLAKSILSGDFLLITGKSGAQALQPVIRQISQVWPIKLELAVVENSWFGPQVTVTGLLTGSDIIQNLASRDLQGKKIFLPGIVLRPGEDVFLDDLTLAELEKALQAPVTVVETSGHGLLEALSAEASRVS